MNFKQVSALVSVVAGSAISLVAAPAFAASMTGAGAVGCNGLTSCTVGDFTLQAGPAGKVLQTKKVSGLTGLGVSGVSPDDPTDAVVGEIDYREKLTASFSHGVVTELGLSFLYLNGNQADTVNEVAKVITSLGEGILRVTSANTAEWTFGGVSRIITGAVGTSTDGAGYYNIFNPFGTNKISSFTLMSVPQAGASIDEYQNSDFALANATVSATVPEPATLAGLAMVGGLVAASRRRRASRAS